MQHLFCVFSLVFEVRLRRLEDLCRPGDSISLEITRFGEAALDFRTVRRLVHYLSFFCEWP